MLSNVGIRSATIVALNADIETLTAAREGLEVIPVKVMFETVISVLVPVRDEMIDDDALVELARCCARACLMLKAATEGSSNLSEPAQKTIESLYKTVRYIQSKVDEHVQGANHLSDPRSGSAEVSPVMWKAELQKALDSIDCIEADDGPSSGKPELPEQPPLNAPSPIVEPPDSGKQALQRLVGGGIPQDELVSSIAEVFSSREAIDTIGHLQASDAQVFIDNVDEALERPNFPAHTRNRCLEALCGVCAGHSLLPRSLQIELGENLTGAPSSHGGFGDVWKREYRGQQVAVKVLKVYENSDLQKITRKFCREFITWKYLRHPNVLPLVGVIMSGDRLMMVSEWMSNGNITEFVKANVNVNRLELLVGVAKGLVYMHGQKMAHGDLKGQNILIDGDSNARLADFGLLSITPDTTNPVSSKSLTQAGTPRWMSPELLSPERFHLKHSRPTESSDCYALAMVVYEVLSGNVPFYRYGTFEAALRVLEGKRPRRPRGAKGVWFNDNTWGVLERCWESTPSDRLEVADVLLCLEQGSRSWSSPQAMDFDSSAEDSTDESEIYPPSHVAPLKSSGDLPLANNEARESHHPVVSRRVVEKPSLGDPGVGDQRASEHLYKSYYVNGLQTISLQLSFFFLIN